MKKNEYESQKIERTKHYNENLKNKQDGKKSFF